MGTRLCKMILSYAFILVFASLMAWFGWKETFLTCDRDNQRLVTCRIQEHFALDLKVREVVAIDVIDARYTEKLTPGTGRRLVRPRLNNVLRITGVELVTRDGTAVPVTSTYFGDSSESYRAQLVSEVQEFLGSFDQQYKVAIDEKRWFGLLGLFLWISGIAGLPFSIWRLKHG